MASFDKAIHPGGEGKIWLKINTKGRRGEITKSATVYTNDPNQRVVTIRIRARIKVPIYVSSPKIRLYGREKQSVTRVVEIRAELERPLILTPKQFSLGDKLTFQIEEIDKGRRFQIRFKSIPGPPEKYHGFLRLKTNYPEKPEMTIWILGRFLKSG